MATSLSLTRDQIIQTALRRCGVLAEGETPSSDQYTDGATALSIIVKEFDSAPWFKWFIKSAETTVATVVGTAAYDLASDVLWVEAMVYDDGSVHYPLEPLTVGEYAKIQNKSVQGLPMYYFVSYDLDTPKVYVYPAPSATQSLNYWYRRKIDLFDNSTDTTDFPEQAYRVLITKLAVDLSFEYGIDVNRQQLLIAAYNEALQNTQADQGQQITGQTTTRESQLLNSPEDNMLGIRPPVINTKRQR